MCHFSISALILVLFYQLKTEIKLLYWRIKQEVVVLVEDVASWSGG